VLLYLTNLASVWAISVFWARVLMVIELFLDRILSDSHKVQVFSGFISGGQHELTVLYQ